MPNVALALMPDYAFACVLCVTEDVALALALGAFMHDRALALATFIHDCALALATFIPDCALALSTVIRDFALALATFMNVFDSHERSSGWSSLRLLVVSRATPSTALVQLLVVSSQA